MMDPKKGRSSERGSTGTKVLLVFIVLFLVAYAAFNYVPVAYEGANFRAGMDTAVVKGLAASGRIKPIDTVRSTVERAMKENNIPEDAIVDIRPAGNVIQAHVAYTKPVSILPFGLYTYTYDFNYVAIPNGYLIDQ